MAKKKQSKHIQLLSPENYIRQKARDLPVFECTVNAGWENSKMATVSVARQHSNGNITAGMFLVDLNCLGVKDAHYLFNVTQEFYRDTISSHDRLDLKTISYELAHNIIYAGLEYAKELGFSAHKDFSVARYILEEDTDDVELIEVECGLNGKPIFMQGQFDSVQKINQVLAQLERSVGKGNYEYILAGEDNSLSDQYDDEEDADDEFSDMSFEEKRESFNELLKSIAVLKEVDHKKFHDLIISVFEDLVDPVSVEKFYDLYTDDWNIQVLPLEEIPFELWGVENGDLNITNEITELFIDTYKLVNAETKAAGKKLKQLKKKVGNIPAVRLLEMMILQVERKEKCVDIIVDNFRKFPDYPVFHLQKINIEIEHGDAPEALLKDKTSIKEFFGNRKSLHEIEFMNYILMLMSLIEKEGNASEIEAFQLAID